MIPEISEFSYGFALTNEMVGWVDLSAAPIFPSLLEEGKAGGGYDVKLDYPGMPVYLQFKRSEFMKARSAREYRSVRSHGVSLNMPYYRFSITEAAKSDQHELLLELDRSPNLVFYAAPRFHLPHEINEAWVTNAVTSRSVFIPPRDIGTLDPGPHTVAFDRSNSWVCSEPKPIEALNSRQVLELIQYELKQDSRPLRTRLPSVVENLRDAERQGRERIFEKERHAEEEASRRKDQTLRMSYRSYRADIGADSPDLTLSPPEPNPPATRAAKEISPELVALREAADIAARVFNAQLIIMQPI